MAAVTLPTASASSSQYVKLVPLSDPKRLPIGYAEDRRSVYWDNGFSPKDYTQTTRFVMTKRQNELVHHKEPHPDYRPCRMAIWETAPSALTAEPTKRMVELAVPKGCHSDYLPGRMATEKVRRSALTYHPSPRMLRLARHKVYVTPNIKFEDSDWQGWEERMLLARELPPASDRVNTLSEAKLVHKDYMPPRLDFGVSKEAMNCIATERVYQLARSKNKHLETEDYDPLTFTVSRSALLAQPSPRIEELATPLPRKIRVKK